MTRSNFLVLVLFSVINTATAQCLTDFQKLIPSPAKTSDDEYGRSIAMFGDYMAVGAEWSDTLAYRSGIIYLYKYSSGAWNFVKLIKPSLPKQFLYFGNNVAMSSDYLVVTAAGYGGSIYVFKKPVAGWEASTNESAILKMGIDVVFNDQSSITISENQNSIIACDFYSGGNCYTFSKSQTTSWTNRSIPNQLLSNPDGYSPYFGASIATRDSTLVIGDQISVDGKGALFVYQFLKAQSKYVLRARLQTDLSGFSLGLRTTINDEGIFTTYYERSQQVQNIKILFYSKPLNGSWVNSNQTCSFHPKQSEVLADFPISLASSDNRVFFAYSDKVRETGELIEISKSSLGWCNPTYQIVSTNKYPFYYGFRIAAYLNKVATSLASSQDKRANQIAVDATTRTSTGWINQRVVTLRNNTRGHYFGTALLMHQNYLFTSAPLDNSLRPQAGKIYIYSLQGTRWLKSGELFPELSKQRGYNFGSAFAAYDNELAVNYGYGSILIFQNNGDWNNPSLVQTLTIPEIFDSSFVGGNSAMSMNDKWLVITAISSKSGEKNSLIIYQKVQGQWVFHQQVIGSSRDPLGADFISVDLDSNLMVFGETSYIEGGKGGIVYLLKLNASNQWEIKYELTPSSYGNQISLNLADYGASVDIEGDHIFVGAPGYDTNSISNLGAVFVYARPNSGWKSMTESAIIYPKDNTSMTMFGASVKASGNLLMVGAPFSDTVKDGIVSGPPGYLHVYQGWNYNWTRNIRFLTLQGDTFHNDDYGLTSTLNKDYLFIGAPAENLSTGLNSGSVYATKMPPQIKLVAPVCLNSGHSTLFGYPYGGVWSGKGIVNSTTGEFDPELAGIGVHELTYITPNCFYPGKLQIEVKPPVLIVPLNALSLTMCKVPLSTKSIAVQEIDNQTYKWFYRVNSSASFAFTNNATSSIMAGLAGEYFVEVSNEYCSVNSPIFTLEYEQIDIIIDSMPPVCDQNLAFIELKANPAGGIWSGNKISTTGLVLIRELPSGNFTFSYQLQSATGCFFTKSLQIVKSPLPDIKLDIQGDLCGDEPVQLVAQPSPNVNYEWFRYNEQANVFDLVTSGIDLKSIEVSSKGKYYLKISNDNCSKKTLTLDVNKRPQDSIFVANVITPNDDDKNDVLMVNGNIENYSLKVINRYGGEVFFSDSNQPWDGKGVSPGVYFWLVNYEDCFGNMASIKGWVQVILGD